MSLLEVILAKLKWAEEPDPDDADEDDIAEFEKIRKAGLVPCFTDDDQY